MTRQRKPDFPPGAPMRAPFLISICFFVMKKFYTKSWVLRST